MAQSLNNLGGAWVDLGDSPRAIAYYEQSLEIKKRAFGYNHPSVATTLNNLGLAWADLGEARTAIDFYRQAYDIAMGHPSVGEDHPKTQKYKQNLGHALDAAAELPSTLTDSETAPLSQYIVISAALLISILGAKYRWAARRTKVVTH